MKNSAIAGAVALGISMSISGITVRHSLEVVDDKGDEYSVSASPSGKQVCMELKLGGKEYTFNIPTEIWLELVYFNPEDVGQDEEEG